MKHLFLVLLFPFVTQGQTIKQKLKLYTLQAPGYFSAGMADGLNQALIFHYPKFKAVHPGAKDQYWNPAKSWTNKNGRGFMMETSLVFITDGYHLTRTLGRSAKRFNTMLAPRVSIPKQKWYWYPIDFLVLFGVESAGFHLTYSVIYK